MRSELVFVHGRAQENKDASALKAQWIEALEAGLGASGLSLPIGEDQVRFPYYGQTLFDLVEGAPPGSVAEVIIRGKGLGDDAALSMQAAIIEEIRQQLGISEDEIAEAMGEDVVERGVLNWEWVQGILTVIDRRVPFGSGLSIALFTRDVYHYLKNPGTLRTIELGLKAAIKPQVPTVVVGHSLGSVVAYNLLRSRGQENGWTVPLFVTVGSPLAVSEIRRSLAPNKHPACANNWFNAMDSRDVVALYPLDAQHFPLDPAIENKTDVRNRTENRHGIEGYLEDPVVAKRIHDALVKAENDGGT